MRAREATIVAWHGTVVEWRVIRMRGGAAEITGSGRADVPDLSVDDPDAMDRMFAAVGGPRTTPLCLLFPARDALLHLIDLPESEPDELSAMASLQMDKLSPFPSEQIVSSAERLGTESDASGVRVLAAVAVRAKTRLVLDAAERNGRTISRLDLDILAWIRLLRDAGALHPTGTDWHFRCTGDDIWMLCCTDGRPDLLRVLAGPFDDVASIREEIQYSLASRGVAAGGDTPSRCILWTETDEEAQRVSDALPPGTPSADRRRNGELPPLVEGGARRAMAPGLCMNLVLPEWAGRQRARQNRRGIARSAIGVFSVWMVALAIALTLLGQQRRRARRLEAAVLQLEAPAQEVRLLLERARSLENYADRSRSAIETMREVVHLLPEGVTLTRFDFRKDRGIDLAGEASDAKPIFDFIERMESSPHFSSVRPGRIEPRRGDEGVLQFPVSALLHGGSS